MKPRHRLVAVVVGIAVCAALALLCGPPASGRQDTKAPPATRKAAEKRIVFQMQATPWKKVFEWLAAQTGQPVVTNFVPTGTFTFIPPATDRGPRTFTITEVIDLVNEALLVSKWVLIRRPAYLVLVPADEPLDGALAPLVHLDELAQR